MFSPASSTLLHNSKIPPTLQPFKPPHRPWKTPVNPPRPSNFQPPRTKTLPYAEAEIPQIIHLLTQSPPSTQRKTLETYFTPSASFTHPFCRTGSFEGSRWLIWCIYRWYKILSPRIEISVDSVGAFCLIHSSLVPPHPGPAHPSLPHPLPLKKKGRKRRGER